MAYRWTSALAVGIREVDAQHQELFNRAKQLSDAMSEGRGRGEIEGLLAFLGQYAVEHFGAEERLMDASRYSGLIAHKRQHKEFVSEFQRMSADVAQSGASSAAVLAVHRRIGEWLREHIQVSDQAFGRYYAEHAAKAA